jgi:hypothetical protein
VLTDREVEQEERRQEIMPEMTEKRSNRLAVLALLAYFIVAVVIILCADEPGQKNVGTTSGVSPVSSYSQK